MIKIDCGFITNSVPTAVWISTLINTYVNFEIKKTKNYWIEQPKIRAIAALICNKNIDHARISQWCNADHPNGTYNYLRAHKTYRRLSFASEFGGHKECPNELPMSITISSEIDLTMNDLLNWYTNDYSIIDFSGDDIVSSDHYNVSDISKQTSPEAIEVISEVTNTDYFNRVYEAVDYAWNLFENKVGYGGITINKEASMQLQFAYIIQQVLPLVSYSEDEIATVELETGIFDGSRIRESDIMIYAKKGGEQYRIVIELKCYKTYASSGGKRGAHDIFMKDIYLDMELVEKYIENKQADCGMCFVMSDYKTLISPIQKRGKCWDYDTSQGTNVGNTIINTPIGGYDVEIQLKKNYLFDWSSIGDYYFVKLEGQNIVEV